MRWLKYNNLLLTLFASFLITFLSCNEDPYIVGYEGFTCSSDESEFVFESGSSGNIEAKVISENGLKEIKIIIGAWTSTTSEIEETILVKGSPKIYDLNYSFSIPDDAKEDNEIIFILKDYSDATIEFKATVSTVIDDIFPTIEMEKPIAPDNQFSPLEKVPFMMTISDNKKIKEASLSCDAISYSKVFKPENSKDKSFNISEYVDMPDEGVYTFVLKAYDAQGNLTQKDIDVIIKVSSKPAIVNQMENPMVGVSGGKLSFNFKVSTNNEHTITSVIVKTVSDDAAVSKKFTPNVKEIELIDALDIPSSADAHVNDLRIVVTAENNIGETSEWTGYCSVIKNVYIFGNGTIAKENIAYSMPMAHVAGSNSFTYKTYIEVAGDGFRMWTGSFSSDPGTGAKIAVPTNSWGKKDANTVEGNSTTNIAINSTGYYVVTFDPVTLKYSVVSDADVPSTATETGKVYAQVNNLLYYSTGSWATGNWNFVQFNGFSGNVHRFYLDVKTNGTGWDQAFLGLAAQAGDKGVMYGVPGGGWIYTFNGFTCSLLKETTWDAAGKISEKGDTPKGTKYRMVVDTYLMQMGWLQATNYSYPPISQ